MVGASVNVVRVLSIAALVILVAGSSYGYSRMMIGKAVEEAKPLADQRNEQRAQMLAAEQQQARIHARQDTLTVLLGRLEEKLRQAPKDSMLLISAGNIAYDLQQYEKAENHYKVFLETFSQNQLPVRIDYGFTVFQNGRQEEGKQILQDVLKRSPKNQTALFNLAYMYQQQNNVVKTKELLTFCKDADPTSAIGKNAAAVLTQLSESTTATKQATQQ